MTHSLRSRVARPRAVAVLAIAAAMTLAACSSSGGAGGNGNGNGKIGVVIKGLDNPFFQTMKQGVDAAAKSGRADITIQAAQSITDTSGQADKLNALANQNFNCFVVNPITGTNLVQGIARIAAKKKTIVNIDSPVDAAAAKKAEATIATYIGTDNTEAGKLAGQEMVKQLPSGGSVAVIGGTSGDVTSGARITGFKDGVAGSSVSVTQTVAANWDRQTALTQATTLLQANRNLAGFFVANDDMALGVARAVANLGRTGKVKIISVDGIKDALTAVKAGQLTAVVAQYPYVIGEMGVEACQAADAGKTLPKSVKAPVELVTQADAAKALAKTPQPFGSYNDPFSALIAK
jgi:ABC-type sugar transport system substrate-binding protein